MIELRLNPNEDKAKPLLQRAQAVVCEVRLYKAVCRKKLKSVEQELLEESKNYLTDEWDRVKRGEPRHRVAMWSSFMIGVIGVVALVLGLVGLVMEEPGTVTEATSIATQVEAAPADNDNRD